MLPDYDGKGLVNIMSTIESHLGGNNPYPRSTLLQQAKLDGVKNIIVIIIDGLGYNAARRHFAKTAIARYLMEQPATSVFPSTTAAAMSSVYTGMAPQEHGILAWFTYFKELGAIGVVPPMLVRREKVPLFQKDPKNAKKLLGIAPIFDKIDARSFIISPSHVKGVYNEAISGKATRVEFQQVPDMLARAANVVRNYPGRKLVLAYWPGFDTMAHEKGPGNKDVVQHGRDVLDQVGTFMESEGDKLPNTRIIVMADHGQVTTPPDKVVKLEKHPELERTLAMPLTGEPRAAFCYVRPSRVKEFEEYVCNNLSGICTAVPGSHAIENGYFGKPGAGIHARLFDRVGDYILLMDGDHVIKDTLLGEARTPLVGHHGGLDEEEMLIPFYIN